MHRHIRDGSTLQHQIGKSPAPRAGIAHHNTAGVQVVAQRAALAQKLGAKDNTVCVQFGAHAGNIAHGNGGFDHHGAVSAVGNGQTDHMIDAGSVERVGIRVIIGRRRHNNQLRAFQCGICIGGGLQVQRLLCQKCAQLLIDDGVLTSSTRVVSRSTPVTVWFWAIRAAFDMPTHPRPNTAIFI